jgi:hypothetical protein
MDALISKPIQFNNTPLYVAGIYLSSKPDGKTEKFSDGKDYNFTNFNVITFMSRDEYFEKYKSKYPSRKAFDDCDDYDKYLRTLTSFIFDTVSTDHEGGGHVPTPLPAALPLMGSVLGGFGFAMWRRRRKRSA